MGISKKAGATVALAVIAGSPLAPLIADELDATPPAAVAPAAESETAGAVAGGRSRPMPLRLTAAWFILRRWMLVSV